MEVNPPPYNPTHTSAYPSLATAPTVNEMCIDTNSTEIIDINVSPTQQLALNDELDLLSSSPPALSMMTDPPRYSTLPTSSEVCVEQTSIPTRDGVTQSSLNNMKPLRCKSGTVDVGVGDITDIEQIRVWRTQFIQVRDCTILVSPSKDKRNQVTTVSLSNRYVSMPGKRLVAVQGGNSSLVIKTATEVRAHQWFMALSQYCYVAPMMDGYAEKLSRGKKVFEEKYLRLTSDGVLSWYRNDGEDAERKGSIQLRGELCTLDNTLANIVHIQIQPKGYQFRFDTPREAQLWLSAFQWHFGRKPLRKAAVPLRNKASSK